MNAFDCFTVSPKPTLSKRNEVVKEIRMTRNRRKTESLIKRKNRLNCRQKGKVRRPILFITPSGIRLRWKPDLSSSIQEKDVILFMGIQPTFGHEKPRTLTAINPIKMSNSLQKSATVYQFLDNTGKEQSQDRTHDPLLPIQIPEPCLTYT
ncbi:hypothetical protein AVEN_7513-1 [Araneus ventricosus]|uniref:Uncharacterized protein n=1 Tax=Araneus ventricosus TaxID=182803 RepID=A0A4Y2NDH1_ARAVE|nr:hypothetical protein AVEN_7513-1 [Araneus ventricosus]